MNDMQINMEPIKRINDHDKHLITIEKNDKLICSGKLYTVKLEYDGKAEIKRQACQLFCSKYLTKNEFESFVKVYHHSIKDYLEFDTQVDIKYYHYLDNDKLLDIVDRNYNSHAAFRKDMISESNWHFFETTLHRWLTNKIDFPPHASAIVLLSFPNIKEYLEVAR